jgi:hypothetical protein
VTSDSALHGSKNGRLSNSHRLISIGSAQTRGISKIDHGTVGVCDFGYIGQIGKRSGDRAADRLFSREGSAAIAASTCNSSQASHFTMISRFFAIIGSRA